MTQRRSDNSAEATITAIAPPLVDHLRDEPSMGAWVVTFVPSDDVSPEPKETVVIKKTSHDGRQIGAWLVELSSLLGRTVLAIHHGGGDVYRIETGTDDAHLPGAALAPLTQQRLYHCLQRIAIAAETAFRIGSLRQAS